MATFARVVAATLIVTVCGATTARAQTAAPIVQPAADGIFEAFKTHPLVGFGDEHGLKQGMDFYAALVRDPRFAREIGNIVVEFGAGGRQDVIDRYVAGEKIPYAELRSVWADTVGWIPTSGYLGFAKFFAAVRAVNKTLPASRRIRIWLGEPAIDWSTATRDQFLAAMNGRDSRPAEIVERLLAQNRKALVIYGGFHLGGGSWLRGRVEARHPGAFFIVLGQYGIERNKPGACAPIAPQVKGPWPVLVQRSDDAAMRACATLDARSASGTFTMRRPGTPAPAPGETRTFVFSASPGAAPAAPPLLAEADAVIFYGPGADATRPLLPEIVPDYFLDPDYRREVARRATIGGPALARFPANLTLRRADAAIDLEAPGYAELVSAMFAQNDKNRDGMVTADEYIDPIPQ